MSPSIDPGAPLQKSQLTVAALLTSKETAAFLKVSPSWLAKARMGGEGPAYIKFGRSVRYTTAAAQAWLTSRRRFSTDE